MKTLEKILNQKELDFIEKFANDEHMRNAVKKVLLYNIYYEGTLKEGQDIDPYQNFAFNFVNEDNPMKPGQKFTNEEAGARLRAAWEGVKAVERAYNEIENYEKVEEKDKEENPAL